MEEYFKEFGGVRDYLHEVVARARMDGYTATMMGRRRYLPDLTSDNRQRREMAERMALNAPIQGSAADVIKVAMLATDSALTAAGLRSRILLQVHDKSSSRWRPASSTRSRAGMCRHGRSRLTASPPGRISRHRPKLGRSGALADIRRVARRSRDRAGREGPMAPPAA